MSQISCVILISLAAFITGCSEKVVSDTITPLQGVWVRENDPPGKSTADTLTFSTRNGTNILSFYSAGSPGPDWPSQAETEYQFENGKLQYRNYFGGNKEFFEVESFQWVVPEKTFSVKLYQIVRFMSADYRVTYRRID